MKFLLSIATILLSVNVFATTTLVNDVDCGSYDRATNEGVCVVFLTDSGSEIGLIFNEQEFLNKYSKGYPALIGQNLEINFEMVSQLESNEEIAFYQAMNDRYFYLRADSITTIME